MQNKNKAGFTLIELLIVIAIIGILASVVLVSLNSARSKALDAAITKSAATLIKAAQIDSLVNDNYDNWTETPGYMRIATEADCDSHFAGVSNPASARAACKNIVINTSSTSYTASSNWKLFLGNSNFGPKLSIIIVLPGAQKIRCVGSNGGSSSNTNLDGRGCGGPFVVWSCPGCLNDTANFGN